MTEAQENLKTRIFNEHHRLVVEFRNTLRKIDPKLLIDKDVAAVAAAADRLMQFSRPANLVLHEMSQWRINDANAAALLAEPNLETKLTELDKGAEFDFLIKARLHDMIKDLSRGEDLGL